MWNIIYRLCHGSSDRTGKRVNEKGKSLKEICFHVGYKDPNYFSRVFRRNTGFSPTEYRSKQFQKMS
ncbi:helix-turn-helix domain-containing protein [Bacillus sp. N9]